MARGFFITFEGGEGAGKSTQVARLAAKLRKAGHEVVATREPGGSPGAEALRHVILSGAAEPFGPRMEALLFAAARADHIDQVIRPALEAGKVVLCDRFLDSSRVYQGLVSEKDAAFVAALEPISVDGVMPDMTLVLDIEAQEGLRRAAARRQGTKADRFEREELERHDARREAFLAIARQEPDRCLVIDASFSEADVEEVVTTAVFAALDARAAAKARAAQKS